MLQVRVEAELLRDTPMVGKFFSLALWPVSKLFEYKVEGSLGKTGYSTSLHAAQIHAPALPIAQSYRIPRPPGALTAPSSYFLA